MIFWNELANVDFWRSLIVQVLASTVVIIVFIVQLKVDRRKQREDRAREAEIFREEREKEASLHKENNEKELRNIKLNTMIMSRPYLVLVTDEEVINQPTYELEVFALKDTRDISKSDLITKTVSFPLYNAGVSAAVKVLVNNYHRNNDAYIVGGFHDRIVDSSALSGDKHYFSISKSIPKERYINLILKIKYDSIFFKQHFSSITFDIVYEDIYRNVIHQPVTVELSLQSDNISFYPQVEYEDADLNGLITPIEND